MATAKRSPTRTTINIKFSGLQVSSWASMFWQVSHYCVYITKLRQFLDTIAYMLNADTSAPSVPRRVGKWKNFINGHTLITISKGQRELAFLNLSDLNNSLYTKTWMWNRNRDRTNRGTTRRVQEEYHAPFNIDFTEQNATHCFMTVLHYKVNGEWGWRWVGGWWGVDWGCH